MEDKKLKYLIASDSVRNGLGLEVYIEDNLVIEIFRNDNDKSMTVSLYKKDIELSIVEESINAFRNKIPQEFMD